MGYRVLTSRCCSRRNGSYRFAHCPRQSHRPYRYRCHHRLREGLGRSHIQVRVDDHRNHQHHHHCHLRCKRSQDLGLCLRLRSRLMRHQGRGLTRYRSRHHKGLHLPCESSCTCRTWCYSSHQPFGNRKRLLESLVRLGRTVSHPLRYRHRS